MGVLGSIESCDSETCWVGLLVSLDTAADDASRGPRAFWENMIELGFATPPLEHQWKREADPDILSLIHI